MAANPKPARDAHEFDALAVREDFPILAREINGKPLIYFDNAATTQKPAKVIDRITQYYANENSNIHRGVHTLSEEGTEAYEAARATVATFLNAVSPSEIVFTRGTTEGINLVAQTLGREALGPGKEVLITELEHHSNIVPWQMICAQCDAELKVAPITDSGEVDIEAYEALLCERTAIVAISHISNALGTINPITEMISAAKRVGAKVLVDGAQGIIHAKVDVQRLGCDFYAFSGHKALGPTGIGALYGRQELLEALPPYQGGGDMIKEVHLDGTIYNDVPYKFEAGTPNIAGTIGLAAALDYFHHFDIDAVEAYEAKLLNQATEMAREVPGLRIIGTAQKKTSVLSFNIDGVHPHDLGTLLDHQGIAIRTGHHCAMPVMDKFGLSGTARASFCFYNLHTEVESFFSALSKTLKILT